MSPRRPNCPQLRVIAAVYVLICYYPVFMGLLGDGGVAPELGAQKKEMHVGRCRLNGEDNIHLKTSFMRFWICLNIVLLIGSRNESFFTKHSF